MVVRGKTTIKEVCANLMRSGGGITFDGLYTPGRAWRVQQTLSMRLIAICRAWVVEEVHIACIGVCFKSCYAILVDCIIVAIYPYHPPNQLSPMLVNDRFNVLAFCYH